LRDYLNYAEKAELIESAEEFMIMRKLRNQEAYDYSDEDLDAFYGQVFQKTQSLVSFLNQIIK